MASIVTNTIFWLEVGIWSIRQSDRAPANLLESRNFHEEADIYYYGVTIMKQKNYSCLFLFEENNDTMMV